MRKPSRLPKIALIAFTVVGCGAPEAGPDEEATDSVTSALSSGSWRRQGTPQNCSDLCGGTCACISDRCGASPNGKACFGLNNTCNHVYSSNVQTYVCDGPRQAMLNVVANGPGRVRRKTFSGIYCYGSGGRRPSDPPNDCSEYYVQNTHVTLEAGADANGFFRHWDASCGTVGPYANEVTVDMNVDKTCTAYFGP